MISVSAAFGLGTTSKLPMYVKVDGYWDDDNQWVAGAYTPAITINVTPIPVGDTHGTHGESLKADKYGERYPAAMKFHSRLEMPHNAVIIHGGVAYKITKVGDYNTAGFWASVGQKLNTYEFAETLTLGDDQNTEVFSIVSGSILDTITLQMGSRAVSLSNLLRYTR